MDRSADPMRRPVLSRSTTKPDSARDKAKLWYDENKQRLTELSSLKPYPRSSQSSIAHSSSSSTRPASRITPHISSSATTDVGFLFESLEDQLRVLIELVDVHSKQVQTSDTPMKDLASALTVAIEGNMKALSSSLKHARAKIVESSVKRTQVLSALAEVEKTEADGQIDSATYTADSPLGDATRTDHPQGFKDADQFPGWVSSIQGDLTELKNLIGKPKGFIAKDADLSGLMEARERLQQQLDTFGSPIKRRSPGKVVRQNDMSP